jgi:hypothetical protein
MSQVIEMKKAKNGVWARRSAKLGTAPVAGFAAGTAAAVDHSTAINDAFTDGSTNVTTAVTGVIALVAIVTGLGMIVSILRR